MKIRFYALLLCAFVLSACQTPAEKCIGNLKDLVETISTEGKDYTAEQWDEVSKEFDELIKEASELEGLTDEQKEEISKLQGKVSGAMIKGGFDALKKSAGEELKNLGEALEGFIEGMKGEE